MRIRPARRTRRKKMTRKFLGIGVLLMAASLLSLRAQDISVAGEWELVAGTQKGDVTWKVVFAQTGEALEVTMTGPKGNAVMGKGTLKGDAIEWGIRVSTPRGEIDIVYKGVVAGDAMTGEVNRGNLGTAGWSAKRKAPSS
jgi:hypothetical protein